MAGKKSSHRQLKYRLGISWEEYQKRIQEGRYQFHTFSDGFAITEIVNYAEERVCQVHLVGGGPVDRWKEEAEKKLLAFAKQHQCKALEAVCRPGMAKLLKPMGWRRSRIEMRKEIE